MEKVKVKVWFGWFGSFNADVEVNKKWIDILLADELNWDTMEEAEENIWKEIAETLTFNPEITKIVYNKEVILEY